MNSKPFLEFHFSFDHKFFRFQPKKKSDEMAMNLLADTCVSPLNKGGPEPIEKEINRF